VRLGFFLLHQLAMALNTKTIKRRIKSIGNTKKITKAMEMISAVKMRKAVAQSLSSRSYADYAWEMLLDIGAKAGAKHHPLLANRAVKKVLVAIITSNRGLSGGFSTKLLQEVNRYILEHKARNAQVDTVVMGKKGKKIHGNFGHSIIAEFEKADMVKTVEEIMPLARYLMQAFSEKKYDHVVIGYMHYTSPVRQIARVRQILPVKQPAEKSEMFMRDRADTAATHYKFEPDPLRVLELMVPRVIATQIFQATLESNASEHSARMVAMKNATDAAKDMIKDLTSTFNKARQAAITQEIAEIVGGAAAL
jgi:F-type H+-transporting ATPase subunit gamma